MVARHCLSAFPWRYIRAKVCALRRARSNETRRRRSNTLHETCSIYQRLRDAPARVLGTCIFARAIQTESGKDAGERRERETTVTKSDDDDERDKGGGGGGEGIDEHPENGSRRLIRAQLAATTAGARSLTYFGREANSRSTIAKISRVTRQILRLTATTSGIFEHRYLTWPLTDRAGLYLLLSRREIYTSSRVFSRISRTLSRSKNHHRLENCRV